MRLDDLLTKLGIGEYFERAGLKLNSGKFFGLLVYWFLVIAFILAASDVLGLYALSSFLSDVLLYLPNIVVAILIMLAAVILANFAQKLVKASVMSAKLRAAKFLAALSWWSIIIFGFLTALMQLGIAVSIINTLMARLYRHAGSRPAASLSVWAEKNTPLICWNGCARRWKTTGNSGFPE